MNVPQIPLSKFEEWVSECMYGKHIEDGIDEFELLKRVNRWIRHSGGRK